MITLRNSGPLQPPPILDGFSQNVLTEIQSWPGMLAVSHWMRGDPTIVDGAEFHVNERELGHIHLDGEVHLLLTKKLSDELIADKLASPFRWGREWVVAPIESFRQVKHALWLFRLGYERLHGVSEDELLGRIREVDDKLAPLVPQS